MAEEAKSSEEAVLDILEQRESTTEAVATQVGVELEDTSFADHQEAVEPLRAGRGVRVARRLFCLAALLLLLLSVYESYSSLPTPSAVLPQREFDLPTFMVGQPTIPLNEAIDRFERRRVFGQPPPVSQPGGEEAVPVRGWRAEVREQWDLLGTSLVGEDADRAVLEAIVMDNRSRRMQFLREGETVRIVEQEVVVTLVEADRVELRRGDEILIVD